MRYVLNWDVGLTEEAVEPQPKRTALPDCSSRHQDNLLISLSQEISGSSIGRPRFAVEPSEDAVSSHEAVYGRSHVPVCHSNRHGVLWVITCRLNSFRIGARTNNSSVRQEGFDLTVDYYVEVGTAID